MWVEWDTALLLKGQWCSSHLSEVALILGWCLSFGMWVLSLYGGISHLACGFSHSTAVSLIWHVGSLIWHADSLILQRCLSFGMLVLSFIFPLKKRQENNPCLFLIIKLNAARAERKASCQNICELFAF